jgi:hypothetical protein
MGYLGVSHSSCNRKAGATVRNGRRRPSWMARAGNVENGTPLPHASQVWEWPIPPGTYVDPEAVRRFVEEEADRGVHIDPEEVRAYMGRAAQLRAALGLP